MTRPQRPVLVTTAPKGPVQDQNERRRRYLITMAVRVVCFVLAIVLVGLDLRWAAAIAVAASLALPWIAVIAANSGPKRTVESPQLYAGRDPKQLP